MLIVGDFDLLQVKAVQWSVNNEQEALKPFTELTGKAVHESGFWLDSSGILGASPDAVVDIETILEAKCPYTERSLTIEAVNTSESFCLEKSRDELGFVLKKGACLLGPGAGGNVFFFKKKILSFHCLDIKGCSSC